MKGCLMWLFVGAEKVTLVKGRSVSLSFVDEMDVVVDGRTACFSLRDVAGEELPLSTTVFSTGRTTTVDRPDPNGVLVVVVVGWSAWLITQG